MKVNIVRSKLKKYLHEPSDTIMLEVLEGKPHSPDGGVWIEVPIADLETTTEASDFGPIKSGYDKYLAKWLKEGLITATEATTGKT
jgi:hypothetical protein